ncbi:hypothetical protein [Leucobacter sp. GX0328]
MTESMMLVKKGVVEGSLDNLADDLFTMCGLTWVYTSAGPLEHTYAHLAAKTRLFAETRVLASGIGRFEDLAGLLWTAGEGPLGSYVAVHCMPDADSHMLIDRLVMPTDRLEGGVTRDMVQLGEAQEAFARLHSAALTVPVWEIAPFRNAAPIAFPVALRAEMLQAGWEAVSDVLLKSIVPGVATRTQVLYFGTADADSCTLYSPILQNDGETVPEFLRGQDTGRYEFEAVGDKVFLRLTIPRYPVPPIEQIHAEGLVLAEYADRCEALFSEQDLL